MQPPRAPGGSDAEEIVRHREESRRLDKEPAANSRRCLPGSMAKPIPECEYRVVKPRGTLNICLAGVYGGQVTDGMCRICEKRGDKPAALPTRLSEPGIELKRLLSKFGIHASPDCPCNEMAEKMNAWGPEESLRHIDEIVAVMEKTAKRRKLLFSRDVAKTLVRIACWRAKRKAALAATKAHG